MDEVVVILTNWMRPDNLKEIVPVFARQDCRIVVVDNSPGGTFPKELLELVHDVWRIGRNYGPPCRFAPLFMETRAKYALLYDDDMVPGENCIKYLVTVAKALGDRFSEIGEIGRRFDMKTSGPEYVMRNVRRSDKPVPVDLCCRAHFVRVSSAPDIASFQWMLAQHYPDLANVHDDLMLLGIQARTGWPAYLTPQCREYQQLRVRELPAPDPIGGRVGHKSDRTKLIRAAHTIGWRRCFDL